MGKRCIRIKGVSEATMNITLNISNHNTSSISSIRFLDRVNTVNSYTVTPQDKASWRWAAKVATLGQEQMQHHAADNLQRHLTSHTVARMLVSVGAHHHNNKAHRKASSREVVKVKDLKDKPSTVGTGWEVALNRAVISLKHKTSITINLDSSSIGSSLLLFFFSLASKYTCTNDHMMVAQPSCVDVSYFS